ncbi:MAG: DMT family transporter [Armatimonadota bacterium]|nr:DMT family transporter [Armatimonadota bacterium]MDR7533821.1 DMT family transporter [Armatimonadota bacterium]MDR7536650.1 DMT family transporter [Armatimonadota bacterium]
MAELVTVWRARPVAADAALLAVAGAWGLTFPLGKRVLETIPPFTYLALRFVVAAAVLLVWQRAHLRAAGARIWTLGALAGGVLFGGYAFQTVGLRVTTASTAGFITGLSVALVPVLTALWLRRRPRPGVVAGVVAATVGLALLSLVAPGGPTPGDVLVAACAVCFAVQIVMVDRLAPGAPAPVLATVQVLPVTALSAVAAVAERPLAALAAAGATDYALVGIMALTGTVAALVVQGWAQRFTSPSHVGLMFAFEPVAAAGAAALLLGEVLTPRQAWGAGLILAGIIVAGMSRDA